MVYPSLVSARPISRKGNARRLLSLLLIASAGGCGVVGAVTYKLYGPLPVPAEYVPEQKPMLVLAESYGNPTGGYGDAETFALSLSKIMAERKIAPQVDPTAAITGC